MNQSAGRFTARFAIPVYSVVAGAVGLVACSDDASLGKKLGIESGTGGSMTDMSEGGHTSGHGGSTPGGTSTVSGGTVTATGGHAQTSGGIGELGGSGGSAHPSSGGATGGSAHASTGGIVESGGTGGVAATGGALSTGGAGEGGESAGAGGAGGHHGVILTAVREASSGMVNAEWYNGTDTTIFLRGCSTTNGWYREGGEWKQYGAFAVCAMEGLAVEVPAGQTYQDLVGGVPPDRGDNVWRLVGPYGTGCTRGVKFSQANCAELHEATSVNEVSTK
jgi:hypothetical protein